VALLRNPSHLSPVGFNVDVDGQQTENSQQRTTNNEEANKQRTTNKQTNNEQRTEK